MHLTWKDAIATMFAAGVVVIVVATLQKYGWPIVGSTRWAIGLLGLLGLGMCIFSSPGDTIQWSNPYILGMSVLGGLSAVVVLVGLVFSADLWVYLLGGTIVLMWLVATAKHLIM